MCCGVILFLFAVFQFVSALQAALREPVIPGLDERLSNVRPDKAPWLKEVLGGRWGRYGWYLSPHEQGSLHIRLPVQQPGTLRLRLWAFPAGPLSVNISDGGITRHVSDEQLDGEVITLAVDCPCELIVQATNEMPEDQLILDRFAVWWSDSQDRLPSFYPLMGAVGLCLAGWGWLARQRNSPQIWRLWMGCTLILLAVTLGWSQRWTLLEIARGLPPEPDVIQYRVYAQSLQWFTFEHGFYSGSFAEREPVHVAAINLWSRLWGDTSSAIRWYSVVQSNLLIIVTGIFVWAVSGKWAFGTVTAWIMALSSAWSEESVRGLRVESETILFILVLAVWLWTRGWLGAVLLGMATGLLALLRAPMLSVVLPVVWLCWLINVWWKWKGSVGIHPHHWTCRQLGLASCLAAMIFSPHLYGLYKVHGDSSWPSYGYARWNANFEFPDRIGTQGFPSAEEFAKDPYAGPPVTYGDYLFGLHSISQLVWGQLKGWTESTLYMSVSASPQLAHMVFLRGVNGTQAVLSQIKLVTIFSVLILLGMTIIGWGRMWREPEYWWVPLLSLWGTWYAAYLYSIRLVEPFRHTGHVYPLLLLCFVVGCRVSYGWVISRLESRKSIPIPSC